MKIVVLSCAESEFAEIVDYYNEQCSGLGYEFAAEVQRTFDRINYFPEAWALFTRRSRRCLVDRFPFHLTAVQQMNAIAIARFSFKKKAHEETNKNI
jgi:hypothetical protein